MTRHVPLHHRPQATRALVITSMDRLGPPPVRTWIPELLPNHAPLPAPLIAGPFVQGEGLPRGRACLDGAASPIQSQIYPLFLLRSLRPLRLKAFP
jgi:hypothetical protein